MNVGIDAGRAEVHKKLTNLFGTQAIRVFRSRMDPDTVIAQIGKHRLNGLAHSPQIDSVAGMPVLQSEWFAHSLLLKFYAPTPQVSS